MQITIIFKLYQILFQYGKICLQISIKVLLNHPVLYVNDVTYTSNVLDFILFADDTAVINSKIDIKELDEVTNWFKVNKLSANVI